MAVNNLMRSCHFGLGQFVPVEETGEEYG